MKYKVTIEMYFNDYMSYENNQSIKDDTMREVRQRFENIYVGHTEINSVVNQFVKVEEYL